MHSYLSLYLRVYQDNHMEMTEVFKGNKQTILYLSSAKFSINISHTHTTISSDLPCPTSQNVNAYCKSHHLKGTANITNTSQLKLCSQMGHPAPCTMQTINEK